MRILAVGDVVASPGTNFLIKNLEKIKRDKHIDFCVVNGENAALTNGITAKIADDFLLAGADVITLGNHTFSNKEIYQVLKNNKSVIRPANYPPGTTGFGFVIKEVSGARVCVINAMGRVFMHTQIDCPFRAVDKILGKLKDSADIFILDFHAETTSEKIAMANYFDSRINIIFGTHTHVQTADERVLPKGSAFICDIGMTGAHDSVIGVKKEIIIETFITCRYHKHEKAAGIATLCGAIFEIAPISKKIVSIERVNITD
jgi:metallophosphoesterase (TIGR00282 family)